MARIAEDQFQCALCGRHEQKCRFNQHHQKYCTDKMCKIRRRRARQAQRYKKKYRDDKVFQESERERCAAALQKRRVEALNESVSKTVASAETQEVNVLLLARGLLAQLIDSDDPAEVIDAERRYVRRGQQLSNSAQSSRGSPVSAG